MRAAIHAGQADATAIAKAGFDEMRKNNKEFSANLQSIVFSVGVSSGTKDDWEWCYQKYQTTNIPSQKKELILALAKSKDVLMLQR